MKSIVTVCLCAIFVIVVMGLVFTPNNNTLTNADYLRIHIRANSNLEQDQNVKYKIKDKLVDYLTPKIANCTNKQQVVDMINENRCQLENITNNLLKEDGFNYVAHIKIDTEMFPTRTYEGYTLQSGVYDAIIVELGSAIGNNWWCVVYPPLCFVNYSNNSVQNVVYKSKIWEIIKQFFNC